MNPIYSISVIVPIYNEKRLIEKSLRTINSYLSRNFREYEIIVVESGSTDGSDRIAENVAKELLRIRLIHEGARRGWGSGLRLGFKNARYDLIWPITVDLPFKLETVKKAIPLLANYDCVLSYRISDNRGYYRKIQSDIYNYLVKTVLGLDVAHVNSAFKIFRRDILKKFKLVSKGWFVDAEFAYRLKEKNIPFVEIGVPLIDREVGRSSVKPSAVLDTLKELIFFLRNK